MPKPDSIREFWWSRLSTLGKFDGRFEIFGGNYCFACGLEATLERAHILPHNDGGDETVENLHLLCGNCHYESENLSGDAYWSWFAAKSPVSARMTSAARRSITLIAAADVAAPARPVSAPVRPARSISVEFPATLSRDGTIADLRIDMRQPFEGTCLRPEGANTIIFRARSHEFGSCLKQRGGDFALTLRWADGAAWDSVPVSSTATIVLEIIGDRRPSGKDVSIWGSRVAAVVNQWRLTNLTLR
jgi:hypothetical protein